MKEAARTEKQNRLKVEIKPGQPSARARCAWSELFKRLLSNKPEDKEPDGRR
jgi:hypothetical protein